jgi:2-keto-3-deoxy-L-rhamnonate aldolase RhmA
MTSLRKRLLDGELVVGTMISEVRNPNVAHLLALSGFDFVIIDNEHGAYSPETVSDFVAGARGADIAVIVRVPEIRRECILKPLDSGAAGLLAPQVNTVAEAEDVVQHAKYPPLGSRGVAVRRPHNRYARIGAAEHLRQANEETFIAVQAESAEAIACIDGIAAVEGVDCVFAGPYDLSVSLGIPGQVDHPREVEAIDKLLSACLKHGKVGGILLFDAAMLRAWIDKGMRFVSYSSDISLLADAAAGAVKELKDAAPLRRG